MKNIYYKVQPQWETLYAKDGSPIWIFSSLDEVAELSDTAAGYGLNLVSCNPEVSATTPFSMKDGIVIGLNLTDKCIAKRYAHMTNRKYRNISNLADLRQTDNIDVFVLTTRDFTAQFTELLTGGNFTPGLIMANDERKLLSVMNKYALGYWSDGSVETKSAYVTEHNFYDGASYSEFDHLANADSDGNTVDNIISKDVDFFAIAGHSDGVHLSLPGQKMICPLDQDYYDLTENKPYCLIKQCCPRYFNVPSIKDAFSNRKLIKPDSIKSKVIFINSCFSFRVNDQTLDTAYTLANAFSERSGAVSIIGSFNTVVLSVESEKLCLNYLRCGYTVGETISIHNNTIAKKLAKKLIYLGDPRAKIYKGSLKPAFQNIDTENPNKIENENLVTQPSFSKVNLLILCVNFLTEENLYCDIDAAESALKFLMRHRNTPNLPTDNSPREALDLLKTFASSNRINDAWSKLARFQRTKGESRCINCGNIAISYEHFLENNNKRESQHCPMCDEVYNIPTTQVNAGFNAKVSIINNCLIVKGLPSKATLLLSVVNRNIDERIDCPDFVFNQQSEAFILDLSAIALPIGPLVFRVLYFAQFDIGYHSFKARPDKFQKLLSIVSNER